MRKILILLAIIGCCSCSCSCSCDMNTTETTEEPKIIYYRHSVNGHIYTIEIEGHIYIVCKLPYAGNIIHAEHCPCKTK